MSTPETCDTCGNPIGPGGHYTEKGEKWCSYQCAIDGPETKFHLNLLRQYAESLRDRGSPYAALGHTQFIAMIDELVAARKVVEAAGRLRLRSIRSEPRFPEFEDALDAALAVHADKRTRL